MRLIAIIFITQLFIGALSSQDVAHACVAKIIQQDEDLSRVMYLLESGHFNQCEIGIFDNIINAIKSPLDPWMTAADFRSYVDAQSRVAAAYKDQKRWTKMSILNTARSGKFSTDRTIREYNEEIWKM